jgi:hypothetical protein
MRPQNVPVRGPPLLMAGDWKALKSICGAKCCSKI